MALASPPQCSSLDNCRNGDLLDALSRPKRYSKNYPLPYMRVPPRIGQLWSGRGEDLDVVVELPVGVAGFVHESEAVRAITLEQTDDGRLNSGPGTRFGRRRRESPGSIAAQRIGR